MFEQFEQLWKRNLINYAFKRVKETRVRPSTWISFDLYVLKRKSAQETAKELGISEAAVFRHKVRVITFLKEEILNLQHEIGEEDELLGWESNDFGNNNLKTSYLDT